MDNRERIDYLYLNDKSAPFRPLVRLPSQEVVNPTSTGVFGGYSNRAAAEPPTRPALSNRSSVGSSSRQSNSDSISRRSSASSASAAPSIHIAPPWHLNPPRNMTRIEFPYDLPCEFAVIFGCDVRFDPEQFEEWIQHWASHFVKTGPPQTTTCIFCDHDNFQSWEERMIHIGRHYQGDATLESMRPDFFVIEQLYQGNMLSKEEFDYYMGYTERPPCDHLVEYGYKTPEMEARERRQRAESHRRQNYGNDLAKEDRQMRRDKGKGRSERTCWPSGKNQIYQEPRS